MAKCVCLDCLKPPVDHGELTSATSTGGPLASTTGMPKSVKVRSTHILCIYNITVLSYVCELIEYNIYGLYSMLSYYSIKP